MKLKDILIMWYLPWKVSGGRSIRKGLIIPVKTIFILLSEGLCVQCMHIGSYDNEPATVERMHEFMNAEGYALDITDKRLHHEIYLSDARRVAPEKLKTVIRHPIKRIGANLHLTGC